MRRVVCAANKFLGTIVLGPRHFDITMHCHIGQLKDYLKPSCPSKWEQGFIDQYGVFLTREEAWVIAEAAGQIMKNVGGNDRNGGTLYSENLY